MRIQRLEKKASFTPVTIEFTAHTSEELELLIGFLFLDKLGENNMISAEDSETLIELSDGYSVNKCVRLLAVAANSDFSLTVPDEDM